MANSNGWGDGSANNNIGWGQGAINNNISWGKSHISSWSGATDIDGGNPPVNSVAPALSGTAQEGQTLTCSTGTWSGTPTYSYQWKRNGSNIGSATNSTYTLVTADVGQSIKCMVTATNALGSSNADSNTVTPTSAFTGLLDSYPNAAAAYSLRKLRTAYSGSAIRVRRSSDNAEQDISFVGNDLDTTSMLDFVGYNLWTYSEDISQSVWSKNFLVTSGTPPYIDVETAPDGTLTGDKMIESTSVGFSHFITRQTTPLTIGANYNLSLYLKQGERTTVSISSNISGTTQSCRIDLTNGNISSNTFVNTPTVTAEANGWYRFSVTIVAGTGNATQSIGVGLINASGQSVYTGDGTSGAYVWGFQLSQTSSVKTYQKTVATAGGAGFVSEWYDQSTNANKAIQTTPTSQAQVVLNGNLILSTFTNKITTTWTDDSYALTTGISPNTRYLSLNVVNRTGTTNDFYSLGTATFGGGANNQAPFVWAATTGNINSYMPTSLLHGTNNTTGAFIVTSEKNASDLKTVYVDSVALPTTATEAPTAGNNFIHFGRSGNNLITGQLSEYIYWNSDQSANRTGIETNVNTYWNAY